MLKTLELVGRRLLVRILSLWLGRSPEPVTLGTAPRILVVRLDERVGNTVLLTPVLTSLRRRFPGAAIDVLGHPKNIALLTGFCAVDEFLPYRKGQLLAAEGPLRTPGRLRRRHYDLALDGANPTDPSLTHAVLVRLSGATHTVGPDQPGFGRLYSAPAPIPTHPCHEIDLRLALLASLPGTELERRLCLPIPAMPPETLPIHGRFVVIHVGARMADRRLAPEQYSALGGLAAQVGLAPVFTYGPGEGSLADAALITCPDGIRAPATSLEELASLMARADAVLSCDTGPMHLAVAIGTPTCGIFTHTDPVRYGHATASHLVIDARDDPDLRRHQRTIRAWLARQRINRAARAHDDSIL